MLERLRWFENLLFSDMVTKYKRYRFLFGNLGVWEIGQCAFDSDSAKGTNTKTHLEIITVIFKYRLDDLYY